MLIKYYYTAFQLLEIPFVTYMVNSYIWYFLEKFLIYALSNTWTSGSNVLCILYLVLCNIFVHKS